VEPTIGIEPMTCSGRCRAFREERLRASAVMMKRGKVLVAVHRQGVVWYAVLPADLGSRVLVWLTERRLWGVGSPLFTGPDGSSLSWKSIYTIVKRYRCPREARRCG